MGLGISFVDCDIKDVLTSVAFWSGFLSIKPGFMQLPVGGKNLCHFLAIDKLCRDVKKISLLVKLKTFPVMMIR